MGNWEPVFSQGYNGSLPHLNDEFHLDVFLSCSKGFICMLSSAHFNVKREIHFIVIAETIF